MKIGSIGYNYSHGSEFVMDRPNGIGCWLMLLIKTPAVFEIDGTEQVVRKNSFVLFSPKASVRYRPHGDVYTDDWLYFAASDEDIKKFDELCIPINEIVPLGNTDELSALMQVLAFEHYTSASYNKEIEQHYTEILLYKISRLIRSGSTGQNEENLRRNYVFTQLRSRIFTMPEKVGSIEDMAKEVGMSRSGFQHLYKRIFGVNVMNDVISGRLDRAKRLLISTDLTILQIAEMCGYSNEYNFMKQFKAREGKTPTEFRRSK